MASQLARGFLAEQDLERFVREEHGGNRAAAARAKAASGEACMRNAPKAALKYFRDALDLATTEAARAAVHRLCAAACLEIGHFNRCVGHATRALAVDANDLESLRHRLAAHEALGAWRRMNADASRLGDEDAAAARAAAKGGDQPVELHAPSESHKTVQAALDVAYACVEINQSSRRRVDGVEDDATIQHEHAVKFDFHTGLRVRAGRRHRLREAGPRRRGARCQRSVLWKCASLNLRRARRGGAARDLQHERGGDLADCARDGGGLEDSSSPARRRARDGTWDCAERRRRASGRRSASMSSADFGVGQPGVR